MHILLTNDDGIHASGLQELYKALIQLGHTVFPIAPISEKSGASNSLSICTPIYAEHIENTTIKGIAVTGTPTDCVKIGLNILSTPPDLVVSGINSGSNIGTDILYSGTVSAAIEASIMGIPAIAFSRPREETDDLQTYATHAAKLITDIDITMIPKYQSLNINYPNVPLNNVLGTKICPMSTQPWENRGYQETDDQGNACWIISGYTPYEYGYPGTDIDWILQDWITITPLQFDMTAKNTIPTLEQYFKKMSI